MKEKLRLFLLDWLQKEPTQPVKQKRNTSSVRGFILGMVVMMMMSGTPVYANVSDNLNSAYTKLASLIGFGKEASYPESKEQFDAASMMEKINYLENQLAGLQSSLAPEFEDSKAYAQGDLVAKDGKLFECASTVGIGGTWDDKQGSFVQTSIAEQMTKNNEGIAAKIDAQTQVLKDSIDNVEQSANASYNLFVYIPKTDALADYTGSTITITSESGNQTATATLRDTGSTYSSTIYFNFSGNCELSWTAINELGEQFDITEDITIANSSQEFKLGSVAHRLRVYFPKSVALYAYDDEPISLVQGDKRFSSVLKDDGTNYSAIIYSDFDGTANLKYDFLDEQGTRVAIEEPVNMTSSQMELEIGLNSLDPSQMSWRTINTILKSERAELFGLTTEGTQLPDGWYVVGTGTDSEGKLALQLWRKTNLGNQNWGSANSTAQAYYNTFNTNTVADLAFKSSLLSKTDVETGWLASNRTTGFDYWLETASSSGYHWFVYNGGGVYNNGDSNSAGCAPAVWIH